MSFQAYLDLVGWVRRSRLLTGPVRGLDDRYERGESFAVEAPGYSYAAA
jgi:hypothetical protein